MTTNNKKQDFKTVISGWIYIILYNEGIVKIGQAWSHAQLNDRLTKHRSEYGGYTPNHCITNQVIDRIYTEDRLKLAFKKFVTKGKKEEFDARDFGKVPEQLFSEIVEYERFLRESDSIEISARKIFTAMGFSPKGVSSGDTGIKPVVNDLYRSALDYKNDKSQAMFNYATFSRAVIEKHYSCSKSAKHNQKPLEPMLEGLKMFFSHVQRTPILLVKYGVGRKKYKLRNGYLCPIRDDDMLTEAYKQNS